MFICLFSSNYEFIYSSYPRMTRLRYKKFLSHGEHQINNAFCSPLLKLCWGEDFEISRAQTNMWINLWVSDDINASRVSPQTPPSPSVNKFSLASATLPRAMHINFFFFYRKTSLIILKKTTEMVNKNSKFVVKI